MIRGLRRARADSSRESNPGLPVVAAAFSLLGARASFDEWTAWRAGGLCIAGPTTTLPGTQALRATELHNETLQSEKIQSLEVSRLSKDAAVIIDVGTSIV